METIYSNGIEIEVLRSQRRKTLSLEVRHGQVRVRLPAKLPLHHAEHFVHQKSHWIQQKLADQPPVVKRQFRDGETFLYLGKAYRLNLYPNHYRRQIVLSDNDLHLAHRGAVVSQTALKKQITDWYRQQATAWLTERCQLQAHKTRLEPREIEVKTYRARWGSCTLSGKIQLNWKLIMAPENIIDYVIIHELCHLQEHNHSPAFWQLVQHFDPHFRQHRAWLKKHGYQLQL